jgi:hypothetical protein
MALATGNILRIINHFTQGSNSGLMVSFWEVQDLATPNTYALLAEGFHKQMASVWRVMDVVHSSANLARTVIDNLSTVGEYGEYVEDIPGTGGGDPAPSFVAVSVKQVVETRLTRAGYKRIPFIGEGQTDGNNATIGVVTATAIQDFYGVEAHVNFTDLVTGTIDASLVPIVVGRTETPPGSGIYVLDLAKINYVTSAIIQGATSQTSRKA